MSTTNRCTGTWPHLFRAADEPVWYSRSCSRKGQRNLDTNVLANCEFTVWHKVSQTSSDNRLIHTERSAWPASDIRSNCYCALYTYSLMDSCLAPHFFILLRRNNTFINLCASGTICQENHTFLILYVLFLMQGVDQFIKNLINHHSTG